MFLDCYFHKKLSTINQKTISSFDMISYSENNNNNKTTLSESEATREIVWIVIIKGHVNKAELAIESKRFPCEPKKGRRIRKTHPCYGQMHRLWLTEWLTIHRDDWNDLRLSVSQLRLVVFVAVLSVCVWIKLTNPKGPSTTHRIHRAHTEQATTKEIK